MKKPHAHTARLTFPAFFLLLPVFFVLHGAQEHKGFVPAGDALLLVALYLAAALVFYFVFRWIFRNSIKAALGSFVLMAFHFFFGSLHDTLKDIFGSARYAIVLPACLAMLAMLFTFIKRTRWPLPRVSTYLNVLLLVLIAWDAARMALSQKKTVATNAAWKLPACDTCAKPDIYLLLLDEYAGNASLKALFQFDNADFERQLRNRGFFVAANSISNYNYTPFSMASLLNMEYLPLKDTNRLQPDLVYTLRLIKDNQARRMLEEKGYAFYNHSVFDLSGQPAPIEETAFIPARTRLITAQTFLSRMDRDLGYHLLETFRIKSAIERQQYRALRVNTRLYALTRELAAQRRNQPVFVYTHLMMPHYPYYFDRNGAPLNPARILPEANNINRKDYVEYLQYANKHVLSLIDHIRQNAVRPTAILLMSDHGFRHFNEPVERKYHFNNLNAVYLPDGNYGAFYDSVSNVNQFRILFNTVFHTNYPLLRDSTTYLKD